MAKTVNVRLNQQQLQLLDRAVEQLDAADRAEVLRTALQEYAREDLARDGVADRGNDDG
jgi:Arc/MetJ-type ribon-helix-helix transcriptional regulator